MKTEVLGQNSALMPLCSPHLLCGLSWD